MIQTDQVVIDFHIMQEKATDVLPLFITACKYEKKVDSLQIMVMVINPHYADMDGWVKKRVLA